MAYGETANSKCHTGIHRLTQTNNHLFPMNIFALRPSNTSFYRNKFWTTHNINFSYRTLHSNFECFDCTSIVNYWCHCLVCFFVWFLNFFFSQFRCTNWIEQMDVSTLVAIQTLTDYWCKQKATQNKAPKPKSTIKSHLHMHFSEWEKWQKNMFRSSSIWAWDKKNIQRHCFKTSTMPNDNKTSLNESPMPVQLQF